MIQPSKWWMGLPPLAVLFTVAATMSGETIESEIAARLRAIVAKAPAALTDATVTVDGRDVTVSGTTLQKDAVEKLLESLAAQDGVRAVFDKTALDKSSQSSRDTPSAPPAAAAPPPVSPFVWSAVKDGDSVTISGYAPSQEARDTLAEAAATLASVASVGDGSRVASGAPADFAAAARLALGALAGLEQGKATLTDTSLSIEGAGKANVGAAAVEASLRAALPKGFRLGAVAVAAGDVSPYVFTARKQNGAVTLGGHAPDAATHERLVRTAETGGGGKVADEIAVAGGAPQHFESAASAALRALARLDTGAAAISDRRIAIEGSAYIERSVADIKGKLSWQTPEGYELSARLSAEPIVDDIAPAEIYARLAATVAPGLFFTADNSAIAGDSLPVADALANTLLRCPSVALAIVGHFTGAGGAAEDEAVALRRAEIVRDYLVAAGVDAARLTASGAASGAAEGGAPPRRIEFQVK